MIKRTLLRFIDIGRKFQELLELRKKQNALEKQKAKELYEKQKAKELYEKQKIKEFYEKQKAQAMLTIKSEESGDSKSPLSNSLGQKDSENVLAAIEKALIETEESLTKIEESLTEAQKKVKKAFTEMQENFGCLTETNVEKFLHAPQKFQPSNDLKIQKSYEKMSAEMQKKFDYPKDNNVKELLLQNAVFSYFKDNIEAQKTTFSQKVVDKADVYTFLKACFPRLYQSEVKIWERNDWESALKTGGAWDGCKPQFFEVTFDRRSYVVKSSWRAFEYDNSLKLHSLLKKDVKIYNENSIVTYPKKFALYNIAASNLAKTTGESTSLKPATIEIFANVASSPNELTEDALLNKFLENNSKCCTLVANKPGGGYRKYYRFSSLPKKTIFQLMPKVKGKSILGFLDAAPDPQLSYKIGQKSADALAILHSLGYNEEKKCTTSMHGDFHLGNLIYDDSRDKITLIDVGMDRQDDRYGDFKYRVGNNDLFRLFSYLTGMTDFSASTMPRSNDIMFIEGLLSRYRQFKPSLFQCLFDLNNPYSSEALGYDDVTACIEKTYVSPARVTQYMIFIFHYCKGKTLKDDDKSILKTRDDVIASNKKSPMNASKLLLSNMELADKLSISREQSEQKKCSTWSYVTRVLEFVSCVEEYLEHNKRSLGAIEKVVSLYSKESTALGSLVYSLDKEFNNFLTKIKDL
ncbi:MAG: hypothetical protein LBT70_03990 [Holosporaceae bacterium]|nr:hypothetical protein [Holosporaceae bacterium]